MSADGTIEQLSNYAALLRCGRSLEVSQELINFLSEILTHIVVNKGDRLFVFQEIVSAVLRCQEAEDWLGLADYLEYDLPDFLKSLRELNF